MATCRLKQHFLAGHAERGGFAESVEYRVEIGKRVTPLTGRVYFLFNQELQFSQERMRLIHRVAKP